MGLDSSENRMGQNGKSLLLSGKLENTTDLVDKLLKVTREEVNLYIRKYMNLQRSSLVFVGNSSQYNDKVMKKLWENQYR